jgi:putative tryptophan/tyrosine transport system substrate-binding protein
MRRRESITLLGGAAAAWPLRARAQKSGMPIIGFLRSTTLADAPHYVTAFRRGLKEAGYIEGENVAIEYRWAEGRLDRLPILSADLVRQQVALIVGNTPSAVAAKAATSTIPIVFVTGGDPIIDGLVDSLNRPSGNTTGVTFLSAAVVTKRLELLRLLVPKAAAIALLVNLSFPQAERERRELEAAALAIGHELTVVEANSDGDIEAAFATFARRGTGALFVGSGGFLLSQRELLIALAARNSIPASYVSRDFVEAGGLMSYGTSFTDA